VRRGIRNRTIFADICCCFFSSIRPSYFRLSLKTAWPVKVASFFSGLVYVLIRGKWQSGIFGVCLRGRGRRGNLKAHDRIRRMRKTTTLTNFFRGSTVMAPCFAACCSFLYSTIYTYTGSIYIGSTLSA